MLLHAAELRRQFLAESSQREDSSACMVYNGPCSRRHSLLWTEKLAACASMPCCVLLCLSARPWRMPPMCPILMRLISAVSSMYWTTFEAPRQQFLLLLLLCWTPFSIFFRSIQSARTLSTSCSPDRCTASISSRTTITRWQMPRMGSRYC